MAIFQSSGVIDMRDIDFNIDRDQLAEDGTVGSNTATELSFRYVRTTSLSLLITDISLSGSFEYEVPPDGGPAFNVSGTINSVAYTYTDEDYPVQSYSYTLTGLDLDASQFLNDFEDDDREIIFGGNDVISGNGSLYGFGGNDVITGGNGNDTLDGGNGNDTLKGGAGVDSMAGGKGDDIYHVRQAEDVVIEAASSGNDRVFSSVNYDIKGTHIESVSLVSIYEISVYGNGLANTLTGNSARNTLVGLSGNDMLVGGAGNDKLYGGSGNDKLIGGRGVDTAEGGTGNDTFFVNSTADKVREDAGAGRDLVISTGSFTLQASAEIEFLRTDNARGNLGFFLTGNEFAQTITGNAGSNSLKGLGGNDTLVGMSGADELYGGTGADTFIFQTIAQSTLSARDMIYDFSRAEADKIDLSAIDARTTVSGNQAFTFIGTNAFSNKAGELRAFVKNGETFIHGDLNGDSGIDFSVKLATAVNLISSDFIL